jgi:hypothetical protein
LRGTTVISGFPDPRSLRHSSRTCTTAGKELAIPAGTGNKVEPNGPDAGQPTYFLPRRQRWIYRLRVPADFGNKEVTWVITAHGRAETAYGSLIPAQEITDRVVRGNDSLDPGEGDPNEPPSITIPRVETATISAPLKLTAAVRDDGLPKPRPPRPPRPDTTGGFGAQVDRPAPAPRGLTLTWLQYGGPAKAVFEEAGAIPIAAGQAAATVRFSQPGTYRLRAVANDGALSTTADVVVYGEVTVGALCERPFFAESTKVTIQPNHSCDSRCRSARL